MISTPRLAASIALALFWFFAPLSSSAQDEEELVKDGISWGIRAGFSLSKFGNTQPYLGARSGFYLGGEMEYAPAKWVSVLIRPGYNQYGGSKVSFEDESRYYDDNEVEPIESESEVPVELPVGRDFQRYTTSSMVTVHAIELPVIARFGLDLEKIRLFANVGLSTSYQALVTEKYERTRMNDGLFITSTGLEYTTSEYQPFQMGLITGLGVLFDVGNGKRMAIEINYQYGLTPLKKSFSYIGSNETSGDLYVDNFSIGLVFMF